jgi:rhomboid protease GluP
MEVHENGSLTDEVFFPSVNSPLAKLRFSLWIGLGIAFAVTLFMGALRHTVLITSGVVLVLILPFDWYLRRLLKSGRSVVTLTEDAIESPGFSGKQKRFPWRDIEEVSLDSVRGISLLTFQLRASTGMIDKRSFWTGANPAKPILALSPFTPLDQEKLLDAVKLRLHRASGAVDRKDAVPPNELTIERQFQEQLKALSPYAWVTYSLIAINACIWLATLAFGATFSQASADKLLVWGGNAASEVQRGEWWRLLSAMFLHSGFLHVFMNMVGLYGAGVMAERIYGPRQFALIYFGSGLLGSALSLHFSAQSAVAVGASGAVFGVTGALLVAVFQHRESVPKLFSKQTMSGIGFFIFYSLMQGLGKQGIDNAAHVGGLIGGCALALMLPERFDMEHFRRTFKWRTIAALVITGAATLTITAMAPKAAIDQSRILASAVLLEQGSRRFTEAVNALQREEEEIRAGKLSERESDERSRTVHAPAFRKVVEELSQVTLRPGDPREPMLKDKIRVAELMAESLAMESVFNEASAKLEPADPVRMAQIKAEIVKLSERRKLYMENLKKKR